jgi:hypothetical protein
VKWIAWGLLLAVTNGCSTLTSRARNTPSYWYHGVASLANHIVWFAVNVMFVGVAVDIGKGDLAGAAALGAWAFYAACSTVGSIFVHWLSIRFFEKGNRRVGAYEGPKEVRHADGARTKLAGPPYPSAAERGDVVVVVPPGLYRRPAGW